MKQPIRKSAGALVVAIAMIAGCKATPAANEATCPPAGYDTAELAAIKAMEFEFSDDEARQAFALALIPCLAAMDPALRDDLAYTGLSAVLRSGQLSRETVNQLREQLLRDLETTSEPEGVHRPFLVLVLAEVARVDRIEPLFTPADRDELVRVAAGFLDSIHDYRGFNESEGWRHSVAHGADLVLQLSLNEQLSQAQSLQLRAAIAKQIAPDNGHSYIFGEPGRLARPILYMALRERFTEEEWSAWFENLASPAPFASWADIWKSERGLAKLHNTRAFAQAIYVTASASEQPALKALVPGATQLLRALP